MAKFAWAYVNCSGSGGDADGSAAGPAQSLQFVTASDATSTTGSANLRFFSSSNTLYLTGTMILTGTLSASHYHFNNITNIDATGSTFFGNTDDDMHVRTGSLLVSDQAGNLILSTSIDQEAVYVRGFGGNYTAVLSTPYTVTDGDYILGVQLGNYVTMSFPNAATVAGRVYLIKDEFDTRGTGSIFITGSGGKFDHELSYVMTGSSPAISLYSNGSNWFVF